MSSGPIKFQVSAPGKVILHGEHSVVYGRTAVAASLNLRTNLTLSETNGKLSLELVDVGLKQSWEIDEIKSLIPSDLYTNCEKPEAPTEDGMKKIKELVSQIAPGVNPQHQTALISFFFLYLSIYGPELSGVELNITSELNIGAGLGSSASYSVCLAASLIFYKQCKLLSNDPPVQLTPEIQSLISEWAFMAEKIIHVTPSGIDNSVCTFGSVISFKKGEVTRIPSASALSILLVDTKVSRSTKALVAKVRDLHTRHGKMAESILDAMDEVAVSAVNILKSIEVGDSAEINKLQELVEINQGLLYALGVSHPALDLICQIAAKRGIRGKLTGAGGGGYAYLLLPPGAPENEIAKLKEELSQQGFACRKTELGAQGVTLKVLS